MLAHGPVARARHVAYDAIVSAPVGRRGHPLRCVASHHEPGGAHAEGCGALDKSVTAEGRGVIGDDDALPIERLDNLCRL